jgi:predicted DNA-binding transcriptional regulator AlpA
MQPNEPAAGRPGGDRYLITEEVADYFRTSPATVRYWRYLDTGPPAIKIGRRVLYLLSDLEAWIAHSAVKTPKQ